MKPQRYFYWTILPSFLTVNAFADYFHHRRNDWPKERIPDFTIHASNRLTPLAGEPFGGGRRANGTLDKIDRGHRDDKRRSRSLNSSLEARSEENVLLDGILYP